MTALADEAAALAQGRLGPVRRPGATELQIHIAIVDLLRASALPGVMWFHPASGEHRDKRTAAKLKAMGVRPGVPDLVLFLADGSVCFIEVKRERGGRMSPEQLAFRAWADDRGLPYAVVRSVDEAWACLRAWGCLRASEGRAT